MSKSKQDEVFAEKALQLAKTASNAIEEMEGYLEDIQDETLREETAAKIEKILA